MIFGKCFSNLVLIPFLINAEYTFLQVIFDSKEHVKRLGSLLKSEFDMCSGVIDPKLGVWMLDPAEKEHNLIGLVHKLIPNLSTVVTSSK